MQSKLGGSWSKEIFAVVQMMEMWGGGAAGLNPCQGDPSLLSVCAQSLSHV